MHLFPFRFLLAFEKLGSKRAEERPRIRARDGKGRGEERWTGMITLFVVSLTIKEIKTIGIDTVCLSPVDWTTQKQERMNESKRTETVKRAECMQKLTPRESKFLISRGMCIRPWQFRETPPYIEKKSSAGSIICLERKKEREAQIISQTLHSMKSRGTKGFNYPQNKQKSPHVVQSIRLLIFCLNTVTYFLFLT